MKWVIKGSSMIIVFIVMALGFRLSANALEYKYNMSYIYFGDSSRYSQLVAGTQGSLNEISPAYFSLDSGGNLVLTPSVSSSFVKKMQDEGMLVVPYLTNDWDRDKGIAALNNAEELSGELAQAVSAYNLDGVNIDIEDVTPSEREAYVDFVRLLRSKLPEGKLIVVSVAANPSGTTKGWAGSYDYAGLAEYCDYLMIMAYDESYYGGEPGPVASISFIENSIKYALKVVSKDKIVLGLPFYGRIWSGSGGFPYGYGISNVKVETLIKNYNGTVVLDELRQSACATITIKASDTKPTINGSPLPAGKYSIWFSDEQSIKSALDLVTKYDIKGTGSWSLGQETSDTWNYYKLWLNGCTFSDIQDSWAKDYILNTYMNDWMIGVSPGEFSPDASFTRGQAAAVLVRMLGLSAETDLAYRFSDCGGHWAEAYIDTARKYGVIAGIGNNLFEPDRPVKREEIAVMLNNILGYTGDANPAFFTDVTEEGNLWSYSAISALGAEGILTGYPDGSFRPTSQVTRAEIAAMTARIEVALPKYN